MQAKAHVLKIPGKCLCGKVGFDVELPTIWCAHCHCSRCRLAHGSAFVTWFGVRQTQFQIVSGNEEIQWYHSSEEAKRGFCGNCGSTMFFHSTRWPDEMHIALSYVIGQIDRLPQAHVFYDKHVDWYTTNDKLKRFGGLSGTEPIEEQSP